jgi:cell division septation protein DedD
VSAQREAGSFWRTLFGVGGLLLLAVPGFAIGLFAGVVWREPTLVASHFLGGTREVALAPAPGTAAPAPAADVAAAPPAAPEQGPAAPAVAKAPVNAAAASAEMPPAPELGSLSERSARLAVQVGAFGDAASAQKLSDSLRTQGFRAFVSPSTGEAGQRWRVRVGPMASREEADRVAAKLKSEARLPTWVVEDGRS